MAKYIVKLPSSFLQPRRTRAGITVERNKAVEHELTDEQVAAIEADPDLIISKVKATKKTAPKKAKTKEATKEDK